MPARACGFRSRPPARARARMRADSGPAARAPFLHPVAAMRSGALLRLVTSIVFAAALGGCFVDYDFDNTSFTCADGTCPTGFECVAARCVKPGGGEGDGAGADAAPGSPDAAAPASDAAVQAAACDEQFGASTGYVLCAEAADTCEFFHLAEVAEACQAVCALYGAACVTTYNATEGTECTREEEAPCDTTRTSQICVCTRGASD